VVQVFLQLSNGNSQANRPIPISTLYVMQTKENLEHLRIAKFYLKSLRRFLVEWPFVLRLLMLKRDFCICAGNIVFCFLN
jgi:hypothetical protein